MARYAILQTFYASEKWINLRLMLIAERSKEHGAVICEKCGRMISKSVDIIGHHKIELTPENVHDYSISLNPDNVELICRKCHDKEHKRFGYKAEKKVYIVFGAPLSGKTSYVQEYMSRGDLIVDMDRLYEAVSMLPSYDKPNNLFSNVIDVHNQLLDNIKTRYGKWYNAWIIGGYADRYKREKLAEDLGAELILCDVSKEICLQRLSMDEARRYRIDDWSKYIDKWFEEYGA